MAWRLTSGLRWALLHEDPLFGVKYFCRSTSTILAGSDGCSFDDAPFGGALLRVLKTLKTKRRERPLGDVHGVR